MKNLKEFFAHRIFKILKWVILILAGLFILLVIIRTFHYLDVQKTSDQIVKIHSTKLSIDDVMGKNLPRDPGSDADKTVQGIDSNFNGIRDDVELSVFKEYPNSAKTRAVLLQYAMAMQMMAIQPFVNEEIATEIMREESRADICLSDTLVPRKTPESSREYSDIEKIDSYINFIEEIQINTVDREKNRDEFIKKVRSFSDLEEICDVDLSELSN